MGNVQTDNVFAVPGMNGVYVLGCMAKRVTLYAQQLRAYSLAYQLHSRADQVRRTRILVVGAGVAGLTCAALMTHLGYRVDIIERAESPLHMQRGCSTRYIHPRLHDWPMVKGAIDESADLPIMGWRAATADAVAHQLLAGYNLVGGPPVMCNALGLEMHCRGRQWNAVWNMHGRRVSRMYTDVVLAVGFGVERFVEWAPRSSYWRLDVLGQTPLYGNDGPYLVSGCGDGGLTDAARLLLRGYDGSSIMSEYLSGADMRDVELALREAETGAMAIERQHPDRVAAFLSRAYAQIPVPKRLQKKFASRVRKRKVILLGRAEAPYNLHSTIYNRFIVAQLLRVGLEYRRGELIAVEPAGYDYDAVVAMPSGLTMGAREKVRVSMVVVRHGTDASLQSGFPEVWRRVASGGVNCEDATSLHKVAQLPLFKKPQRTAREQRATRPRGTKVRPRASVDRVSLVVRGIEDRNGDRAAFTSYGTKLYWWDVHLRGATGEVVSVRYGLSEEVSEADVESSKGPQFNAMVAAADVDTLFATVRTVTGVEVLRAVLGEAY